MIKYYFRLAIRNIIKDKNFSVINLIGLATSMAASMLILVLAIDQYSIDNFHSKRDRIFRVQSIDNLRKNAIPRASVPYTLGKELQENYPFVEEMVAIYGPERSEGVYKDKRFKIEKLFVPPGFFKMFDFRTKNGDGYQMLTEPFSIILREEVAEKFFGNEDPLGKIISFEGWGTYTVRGIIPKNSKKSHIYFEALVSSSTLSSLENQKIINYNITDNWKNDDKSYVYIILKNKTKKGVVETILDEISKEKFRDLKDYNLSFYLQPMSKIAPGPIVANEIGFSLPKVIVLCLIGLTAIMILTAAFNYAGLSVAKSIRKAKEYGLRKITGATKTDLILQVTTESVLFSLISLVFGWAILQFILPGFYRMKVMTTLGLNPAQSLSTYVVFFILTLITGLAAGILPAIYVSSLNPVNVIKSSFNIKHLKRISLRKLLLVTQYTFAIIFVISLILIGRQLNFMMKSELGFDKESIYNIETSAEDSEKAKPYLESIPGIADISGASHKAGILNTIKLNIKLNPDDDNFEADFFNVAPNYLKTMGIKVIAGSDFPQDLKTRNDFIIVNRKAVDYFKFGTPQEAIGKKIIINDKVTSQIIGVTDDYKYTSLFMPLKPLILRPNGSLDIMVLRIEPANRKTVIPRLREEWKKVDPYHEINGKFLGDEIREIYSYFTDIINIVLVVGIVTIIVACLGLLGMATYNIQARKREVGIRKVFGSQSQEVLFLVSRSYFKILLIASVIGSSLAYLINNAWLKFIAFRVSFGAGTILVGIIIVVTVALVTIISQILRAANTNPVETLRNE